METWAIALAALSALFSAAAAAASLWQARKASHANDVNVYLNMLGAYGSTDMRDAISQLAAFWRECREGEQDVARAFAALSTADPARARELRGSSRMVSAYFTNASQLYENGLISKRLLRSIIAHPGLNVFYDTVVPITTAENPHTNSARYAAQLKDVLPRHGEGSY